jgi:cell pole-organizing protein PopZ
MEEILASIRRIIESNDPIGEGELHGRPQQSTFDEEDDEFEASDTLDTPFLSQVPANDPGHPFSVEPMNLRPSIDPTVRAPLEPAAPQRYAPSAEPIVAAAAAPEKTLSLADVAARVRAAAGRVPEPVAQRQMPAAMASADVGSANAAPARQMPRDLPPQTSVSPPMQPAVQTDFEASPAKPPAAVAMTAELPRERFEARSVDLQRGDMPSYEAEQFAAEPSAPQAVTTAAAPMAVVQPMRDAEPSADMLPPVTAMSLPAKIEEAALLLSAEAGEQVARSFKELADVFNGIERQSLEDMARDMLQPMLREWLDDNLPTLVERLVREEIERVARGPHR